MTIKNSITQNEIRVASYTDVIGPNTKTLGPIEDGGRIVIGSVPGCWGPMITPSLKSTHEVSLPVMVKGAEVGDGLALHIDRIEIQSIASASGIDNGGVAGRFEGDPGIVRKCPECGERWPESYVEGIGADVILCRKCNAPVSPYKVTHGYTMVFDSENRIALTVAQDWANRIGKEALRYSGLDNYPNASSHSILVMASAHLTGITARMRPFIGNVGTVPSKDFPSSRNAGDIGVRLVDADHEFSMSEQELLKSKTDGHMDIDSVREGAIVICPVKVSGGGIYCGDAHAMQGDGELAGHTTDIVAEVGLRAEVIKGVGNDGPILLPPLEDLPFIARPFSKTELDEARRLSEQYGNLNVEEVAPIQVVGTGFNLNAATHNGIERTANLLDLSIEEVRNRATITGCVEIGRLPGVITISILVPFDRLEKIGIGDLITQQYDLAFL